jgi:hypothetical protein
MFPFIRYYSSRDELFGPCLFANLHWLLFLTVLIPIGLADAPIPRNEHVGGVKMESAFEPWIGQAVVVQLTLGQIKLSLRGTLLKDQSETLLVRPEAGSDVEIPKTKVLAIEESGRSRIDYQAFAL